MTAPRALLLGLAGIALAGCGGASDARTPVAAPEVELTAEDEQVWAPLPPDRSAIPVLVYHGLGPESGFANAADASYGVDVDDFAKQMTLMKHAGYQTVDLQTYVDFVDGKTVDLPPRPVLLTFDDARADSWTGSDGILDELGYNAVMLVDVGRVVDGNPEYLTWTELQRMQDSHRWDVQLHAGRGHHQIHYGPGPDDYGPFYTHVEQGEDFEGWQQRTRSDLEWGQQTLARHVSGYRPRAFSPPFGDYGQDSNNDPRIPGVLLGWLTDRYDAVFTQDVNARARPGGGPPLGRIQVTRATTGGDLYATLLSGKQ